MKKIFSTLLVLLSIFAFTKTLNNEEDFKIISIHDKGQDGSYNVVKPGQKFIIEIDGNPTTGYVWFLEQPEKLNRDIVAPMNLKDNNSADYYQHPNEEMMAGVGGIYRFKFQAGFDHFGSADLNFIYKRSWESDIDRKRVVHIHISGPEHDDNELEHDDSEPEHDEDDL